MASLYRIIVGYMMETPYDQKERDNAMLYEGPNSWFYQTLGGLKYGDDLDVPLQTVQFKSEAYLTCMLNLAGDLADNYQACMKLVDPDS